MIQDLNKYKKEILTISSFVDERPDLAIHTDITIQSAINSAATMLNSICDNLISEVWNYNRPTPDENDLDGAMFAPDPNNKLYRTEYELNNIKEAFIQQTQYTINLGNDYTTGAISGSVGNVNYSSSRNDNQDKIAPGVYTLLAKARVYKINDFVDLTKAPLDLGDNCFYDDNIDKNTIECLNYASGDTRYVRQYQPSINKKNMLLTVNPENKMTYWMDAVELDTNIPDDLVETVFQTTQRLNTLEIDNEANKDLINNNTDKIMDLKTKMSDTGNVIENLINANNESIAMIQTLETSIDKNSTSIENIEQEQNTQNTQINSLNQNMSDLNQYLSDGNLIRFRGVYSPTANYLKYDYVLDNEVDKNTYFAIKPSIDIPLNDSEYWLKQDITQNLDLENYYKKIDGINIENGTTPDITIGERNSKLTKINKYGSNVVGDLYQSFQTPEIVGITSNKNIDTFGSIVESNFDGVCGSIYMYMNENDFNQPPVLKVKQGFTKAELTNNSLIFSGNNDNTPPAALGTIDGLKAPTSDLQATNKKYVDDAIARVNSNNNLSIRYVELRQRDNAYNTIKAQNKRSFWYWWDDAGWDNLSTIQRLIRENYQVINVGIECGINWISAYCYYFNQNGFWMSVLNSAPNDYNFNDRDLVINVVLLKI